MNYILLNSHYTYQGVLIVWINAQHHIHNLLKTYVPYLSITFMINKLQYNIIYVTTYLHAITDNRRYCCEGKKMFKVKIILNTIPIDNYIHSVHYVQGRLFRASKALSQNLLPSLFCFFFFWKILEFGGYTIWNILCMCKLINQKINCISPSNCNINT